MFSILFRIASCCAALIAASEPSAPAQQSFDLDRRRVEALGARYGADAWPRGARRIGFELGVLTLPGLEGRACERLGETRVIRLFADEQRVDRVLVEMDVQDTVDAAHAALLQQIARVSSGKTLPTTSSRGWSTGDAGFIGYAGTAQERVAWIAFAIGNVAFRMVCLDPRADPHPDLGFLATKLTQAALATATIADDQPLPRPRFERLALDRERCAIDREIAIDSRVVDPLEKPVRVDFEVGGTGRGYVETDAQGRRSFHATGAGRVTLTLHALGSNGTVASRSVDLEVTERGTPR